MKQYVIDELRPQDHEKIKKYLDLHFGPAEMGHIYWIPVDPGLHDPQQASHEECHPPLLCSASDAYGINYGIACPDKKQNPV